MELVKEGEDSGCCVELAEIAADSPKLSCRTFLNTGSALVTLLTTSS